ncbi:hypothetical protein FOA52_015111 [Chlamydomonas sp. UWO 241]|nr:hypothetical protein FOA52_015111 [Chlamydomonas sp. UWO 241]
MGKLGEVLTHPHEFMPLMRMAFAAHAATKLPKEPGLAFCYDMLNNVSRSFAVVIQQLPQPLRDAICVFYLVLRGLDTVEDDMALDDAVKLPSLLSFHQDIYKRGFTMDCGYKHYKRLMNQFDIVVDVFLVLEAPFQDVIADITRRMGEGMHEYIVKDVVTIEDYNKYCHYVAGLVGIGLSQLFASSGLEAAEIGTQEGLANHMGLFLQKTNIIRDYLEDILEEPAPRMFWPKEIWGMYGKSLADFKEPSKREAALRCLNHMIVNALQHMPYSVQYMEQLNNPSVFRFCAIPQIMAAGTLGMCYNNGRVFEGVVKMRRGQTATVFDSCSDMGDLLRWFTMFLDMLQAKVDSGVSPDDPTLSLARESVADNKAMCARALAQWRGANPSTTLASLSHDLAHVAGAGAYAYYSYGLGPSAGALPGPLAQWEWVVADYRGVHQVLSALLLVAALLMAVFARR